MMRKKQFQSNNLPYSPPIHSNEEFFSCTIVYMQYAYAIQSEFYAGYERERNKMQNA